ncbi:MAG: hypothetical protein J6A29_02345 [Clostridia bacterium]|nr:hypothetical protein [Clostridia bacterium]
MQNNDKLLLPKIIDKIKLSKNKITNSEFLNEYQISAVEKELRKIGNTNYFFEGGYEDAESKILVAYPEALGESIARKNVNNILKAIKIELPNEIHGKLEHRDYLGTVMSFGLVRERIGDIIVHEDSAYIIVLEENATYLKSSFEYEKRFKKAKISIIDISEIKTKKVEFEEITISVNGVRLDSVISEIIKTSRRIAQEYLEEEKVSINYVIETKATKAIKEKDILIIRGKGKFIVDEFLWIQNIFVWQEGNNFFGF